MIEGLNPCPSCGSVNLVADTAEHDRLYYHCEDCGVEYYTGNKTAVAAEWKKKMAEIYGKKEEAARPAWIGSVREARVVARETRKADDGAGTGHMRPRQAASSPVCFARIAGNRNKSRRI